MIVKMITTIHGIYEGFLARQATLTLANSNVVFLSLLQSPKDLCHSHGGQHLFLEAHSTWESFNVHSNSCLQAWLALLRTTSPCFFQQEKSWDLLARLTCFADNAILKREAALFPRSKQQLLNLNMEPEINTGSHRWKLQPLSILTSNLNRLHYNQ